MKNLFQLFAAASLLALSACSTTRTAHNPSSPQQMPKSFHFKKTQMAKVNYLLFLPKGYEAKSEKRWPLILFLHGAGERGTNIWKVATHGPPKNVSHDPNFPFIIVSPQCHENEYWTNDILLGLLDEVIGKYAVDTNRVYLTGLSMGGYGT